MVRVLAFGILAVLVALSFGLLAAKPAHAADFNVNSAADPGTGGCDATECTLREAITAANSNSNASEMDTIKFSIPGTGVHTISPTSALPPITQRVTIDGYTQDSDTTATSDDAKANTLATGIDAVLLIELNGTNAGSSNGLTINASDSTVRGLVINSFANVGISITGSNNHIEGNFIGTDAAGTTDKGNGDTSDDGGVKIESGSNNWVGGDTPGERNLISGNAGQGIWFFGPNTTGNHIEGNYIGTDASGTKDLGNDVVGAYISAGASGNFVGGASTGEGNLISGNNGHGVSIGGEATSNRIEGNLIGTKQDGTSPLGNVGLGVIIEDASNNTVGDAVTSDGATNAANTIAFNTAGIQVSAFAASATSNRILSNFIFSNHGLGINLSGGIENTFGVTANDPKDPDTGPNRLQNFPKLTSATTASGTTTITGTLNSRPEKTFTIQFFSNSVEDPSNHGEGETFLGQKRVTTNQRGKASFTFSKALPSGENEVTATATNRATGDTSEFSNAVTAS